MLARNICADGSCRCVTDADDAAHEQVAVGVLFAGDDGSNDARSPRRMSNTREVDVEGRHGRLVLTYVFLQRGCAAADWARALPASSVYGDTRPK